MAEPEAWLPVSDSHVVVFGLFPTIQPKNTMVVHLKRIYEARADDDGFRVLVDGLWPRGIKKRDAGIDLWLKDIAPSPELRRWFDHDPERWTEFGRRYREELRHSSAALDTIREQVRRGAVTLLFAARDTQHNHAVVLKDILSRG